MYIGIKSVQALDNYKLLLGFENGEMKEFDMNRYLDKGVFSTLRDKNLFNRVHITLDFIEWPNGIDIDPQRLYEESTSVNFSAK